MARLVDAIRTCAVYAATKALVLSFTEALAEELRGTGVHVMAAHPGAVATGFFDGTSATIDPAADAPEVVRPGLSMTTPEGARPPTRADS